MIREDGSFELEKFIDIYKDVVLEFVEYDKYVFTYKGKYSNIDTEEEITLELKLYDLSGSICNHITLGYMIRNTSFDNFINIYITDKHGKYFHFNSDDIY